MDKDILNYLDKVGRYVQGASEKGFEVYVHGVFVNSIFMTLIGLIIISAIVITCYKLIKKYFETDEYKSMDLDDLFFVSILPLLLVIVILVIGFILVIDNITGIFAPDYVAIKQIIDGIGGK